VIEAFIRKRSWLLPLPLIAIAAYLNGAAVTQLLGLTVAPDAAQLVAARPAVAVAAAAPTTTTKSAEPILQRNPFDHVTGSLVTPPPSEHSDTSSTPVADTNDPFSVPICDGIEVKAVVASSDADWSLASIAGSDKKAKVMRRGSEVGGKKLHYVGWDRVWLTTDGVLCQAKLFGSPPPTAAPTPAPAASSAAPAAGGGKGLDPDLKKGIQAVSATEFNIDRGVVDKILENQAELMKSARIVPVQENGKVTGVRMNGIRPDSLLGTLGMQNGDQLQTINGFDMGSPEKALEAYARLRTADKLVIKLNRGGKTMNLDYNIK